MKQCWTRSKQTLLPLEFTSTSSKLGQFHNGKFDLNLLPCFAIRLYMHAENIFVTLEFLITLTSLDCKGWIKTISTISIRIKSKQCEQPQWNINKTHYKSKVSSSKLQKYLHFITKKGSVQFALTSGDFQHNSYLFAAISRHFFNSSVGFWVEVTKVAYSE